MILDEIVENKRREVEARKKRLPQSALEKQLGSVEVPRNLLEALRSSKSSSEGRTPRIPVIAECKRASPSRGLIRDPYDPAAIAQSYERHGAAAISVLADEKYFGGSLGDLEAVHRSVALPVLCKDFVIDEYQVFEARASGADAILLIAAILDARQMRRMIELVWAFRMYALVEVHSVEEIERAAESNTGIIGINNRDLRTMSVDLRQTERLISHVPSGLLVVSESGIRSRDDIEYLRDLGVGAVLIGEHLMSADDPGRALADLIGDD